MAEPTGLIGGHVIAYIGDYNRDNNHAALTALGGRFAVFVNDIHAVSMWVAAGGVAAHRVLTARFNDDDADAHFNATEYADHVCNELDVATVGMSPAQKRNAVAHGGNELYTQLPARTDPWLAAFIDRCTDRGYRAVVANWAYKNIPPALPLTAAALRRNGGWMGFHEGTYANAPLAPAAFADGAIGGFIPWMRSNPGIPVWITEFAGSATAHQGWQILYNGDAKLWAEQIEWAVRNVYQPYNVPISMFTEEWDRGAGWSWNVQTLVQEVNRLNRDFVYMTQPSPVTVYSPDYICPNGTTYGVLSTDETVYCRTVDNRQMQWKNELGEQFITRPGAIERGADWSSLWTADGKYQGFFYVQYKQRPAHPQDGWGAVWVEDWLTEGEEKTFPCWVVEYWHDGRIKEGPVESPNRIKFVKHYANYTLPTGVTINDVIELLWRGEEIYAYQKDFGLVLWKNLRTGKTNYLVRGASGPAKAPVYPVHMPPDTWRNNLTQTYPPPTTGGKRAILNKCPNNTFINIRPQPNPASGGTGVGAVVGELLINDEVTYYPDAKVGEWVYQTPLNPVERPAGRQQAVAGWVSLQGGAVAFLEALLPPEPQDVTYTAVEHEAVWTALEQTQVALNALRSKLKGAPPSSGGGF